MDEDNISLAEPIKYFDTCNRSEGKPPFTLRRHRQSSGMFLNRLAEIGRPLTLGSISENVMPEFIRWLQERHVNGHKAIIQLGQQASYGFCPR